MPTKTFDAVKLMRELRDKLSREMERMTPAFGRPLIGKALCGCSIRRQDAR